MPVFYLLLPIVHDYLQYWLNQRVKQAPPGASTRANDTVRSQPGRRWSPFRARLAVARQFLGENAEQIGMDGRHQFGLGWRGQLEPGWHTGRGLKRRNNHRGPGRFGRDRD
jgi:hypothetical protein